MFSLRRRQIVSNASQFSTDELVIAVQDRGYSVMQRKWEIIPNSAEIDKAVGDRVRVIDGNADKYGWHPEHHGEIGTVTWRQDAPPDLPGNDRVRVRLDSGAVISSKSTMLERVR